MPAMYPAQLAYKLTRNLNRVWVAWHDGPRDSGASVGPSRAVGMR